MRNFQVYSCVWWLRYLMWICHQMIISRPTNDNSILVQVMVWCRQATSHYLSQYWPSSMSPYGVIMPQWVKQMMTINIYWWLISLVYHSTDRHSYVYCIWLLTKYSITDRRPSKVEHWSDTPLRSVYHYACFLIHSVVYIFISTRYPHSCVASIFRWVFCRIYHWFVFIY